MTSIVESSSPSVLALPDEQLLLRRQKLIARRRQILDEIGEALAEAEAEIQARIERNGGRALLAHEEGIIVRAEVTEQFTSWVYDLEELRAAAALLPEKEAAKVIKHVGESHTIVPAHDEPGSARSIQALIDKYGEQSEVGKRLAACRQRSSLGTKLAIAAEATR